jgi:hypothetical protein
MPGKIKCRTVKKAQARKPTQSASAGAQSQPMTEFEFIDNGDSTCTVHGVSAAGNPVDISSVATLTPEPVSSDRTKVIVDRPQGMTFAMHAVGPLTDPGSPVIISVTATWTDGSDGPFAFDLPVDVVAGGAAGIMVVPGPVTERDPNAPVINPLPGGGGGRKP